MMPKDPVMLLSYVNTQLRDFYPSLAEFCAAMQTEESDLREKLALIDYEYDEKTSLYKNNQALKKMAEKGVPYVEKTHTGRLFYAKRVSYN